MDKEIYWSRFAADFEAKNTYVVGVKDIQQILSEVAKLANLNKTLEIGCGNGTYSKVIAKAASELVASDFSDEMLKVASIELKDIENVSVEKASCFNLPYEKASFDTVFMANVLHIIPEPERALEEIHRVLKADGKIIVLSFTPEGMKFHHVIGMMFRYLKTYGKPPTEGKKLTRKRASEMLTNQGFKIESAELIGSKMKAIFVKASKQ